MFLKRMAVILGSFFIPMFSVQASEELSFSPAFLYYFKHNISTTQIGDAKFSSAETAHYGLPGFQLDKPVGSNTISGVFMAEIADETIGVYQMYAALAHDGITYKMGIFDPSDVSQGFAYLPLKADENYFGVMVAQGSYMGVDFEDLGLSLVYGAKVINHRSDEGDAAAEAATNQQNVGVYFRNQFGPLALSFAGLQVSHANDPKKGLTDAALAAGDYTDLMTTAGCSFETDWANFSLQGEQIKNTTTALVTTETRTNFNVDVATNETDGFAVAVTQRSIKDDTDNPALWTHTEAGYAWGFGPLQLATMLFSSLSHDMDVADDTTVQGLTMGMYLEY